LPKREVNVPRVLLPDNIAFATFLLALLRYQSAVTEKNYMLGSQIGATYGYAAFDN
jgi:hypothetical protein